MSDVAALRDTAVVSMPSTGRANLFGGIFVMSLSSLLLELSLTRVFSVTLFYHFAFLAISIALLGLGAGGVFAFITRGWLNRWQTRSLGAAAALLSAVAIVAVLLIVLRIPVALHLTWNNFGRLTLVYLLSAIPFFFTGLVFSVVFARETARIGALYGADLMGGAAACLSVVPLLNTIGGPNAIVLAGFGMAVAAAIWAPGIKRRGLAFVLLLALGTLIGFNSRGKLIDIIYAKGTDRTGNWVEFARWNAISRIEVDNFWGAKWAVIDADAATAIMKLPPHGWMGTKDEDGLLGSPPGVVNVLRPHGEYAIIGPGGGVDVLRAVGTGSPNVVGIEINPLIATTIMRKKYLEYSHRLYEQPEVHIHVSDGRSWVRKSKDTFDVLQMTLVDTWASTSAGAFALSENNLYTVQAFREYFDHLKPDGIIAITRWEFFKPREAMRVVAVGMEALHKLGVQDTRRHFVVVSNGPLNRDGINVAVLAKKSPFTPEEEAKVRAQIARYPETLAGLYLPSDPVQNPFGELIASNNPREFARHYQFNVAPVTDDAPFFFFTLKLGQVLRHSVGHSMDWKNNLGVAVLFMLLVISILAVAAFLIAPLWLMARRGRRRGWGAAERPRLAPIWYFIAVGLGYILVEIAFIQRFVLFLGHPTYALTVVVFLMLLASGAGSMVSRRWLPEPMRVRLPLGLIVIGLVIYDAALPYILGGLVGLPFGAKLAVSAAVLAPLAFLMGMPFPTGLRALHGAREETIEWAWAMNAASSVLGSVLAMVIAIQFGLTVVLACGAVAYFTAIALTTMFRVKAGEEQAIQAEAA